MKKLLFLFVALLLTSCGKKCKKVEENQVCDARDGKIYETQKIGDLFWFKTNLLYKKGKKTVCPNKDRKLCRDYGRLYRWANALDISLGYNRKFFHDTKIQHTGICPQGWHIPSNAEWMNLIDNKPNDDFFQFSGYMRDETNSFVEFDEMASYWSTEQSLENNACVFSIKKNDRLERNCETSISRKVNNHAIRCVKNHSLTLVSSSSFEHYLSSSSDEYYLSSSSEEHHLSSSSETKSIYYSSDDKKPDEKDIQARNYRLEKNLELAKKSKSGDGKKLEGYIYLLSIFVDTETPHTKWTENEKKHILERQRWALDWITSKANKYNILVGFERDAWGYLDQSIPVKEVNTTGYSWLTRGAKNYLENKQDLDGYISWIRKTRKIENVRVIVYTKVAGRSHAIVTNDPGNRRQSSSYLSDATLIFTGRDERYISKDVGNLFAHEFLHLFGADDLYEEENGGADGKYRQSGQRSGLLKKSIKDIVAKKGATDIMYDDLSSFSELDISDLTACLLGWKKQPENWFRSAVGQCRR
jgi:hypothetical protein